LGFGGTAAVVDHVQNKILYLCLKTGKTIKTADCTHVGIHIQDKSDPDYLYTINENSITRQLFPELPFFYRRFLENINFAHLKSDFNDDKNRKYNFLRAFTYN
jgi:hypothetical protein